MHQEQPWKLKGLLPQWGATYASALEHSGELLQASRSTVQWYSWGVQARPYLYRTSSPRARAPEPRRAAELNVGRGSNILSVLKHNIVLLQASRSAVVLLV